MPSKAGLEEEWKFKLEQWENSGLNAAMWCREHNINYWVFLYWKKKTRTNEPESQNFLELFESPSDTTGIEIEFQGFLVRLSKDFDEKTFQRCAHLLKGL